MNSATDPKSGPLRQLVEREGFASFEVPEMIGGRFSVFTAVGLLPLAFAGVLIGFFIMVNRRRAVTQILGFLMLENGIFLLALLATYGVPFIVEMGVFLDVLVAVLIMEVFVYRIKDNFDSIDVGQLGKLKE